MAKLDTLAPEDRLLLEAIRTPWLSAGQLAARARLRMDDPTLVCHGLVNEGLLTTCTQALPKYPDIRYAPTPAGMQHAAKTLHMSLKLMLHHFHFSPERYWQLRSAMEIQQETIAILHASVRNLGDPYRFLDYELFVPQRYLNSTLFLHARLALFSGSQVAPFYLLLDRGEASVWQWHAHLKALGRWAEETPSNQFFPSLLIVSTREYRARAMLVLASMLGRGLSAFATSDRKEVLRDGLFAARWSAWPSQSSDILPAAPFDGAMTDVDTLQRSAHRLANSVTLPNMKSRSPVEPTSKRQVIDLSPYGALKSLGTLERLDAEQARLLTFLARHPACPVTTIAALLNLPEGVCAARLSELRDQQLAAPLRAQIDVALWAATDLGLELRFGREMQPAGALKRYHFFRADHERRATHTLAMYGFFESLKSNADRRSKAMRRLDTVPGAINTGHIPYLMLSVFESEFMASDWFTLNGKTRFFRPDGYGALRAGLCWTRFWLEIDNDTHRSASSWEEKLIRWCDYLATRRWQLRYATLPRILIVTHDLKLRGLVQDIVVPVARTHRIDIPEIYLAHHDAVQQRGPLGKVWRSIAAQDDSFSYAFDGLERMALKSNVTPRLDLITELDKADALGVLDAGELKEKQLR